MLHHFELKFLMLLYMPIENSRSLIIGITDLLHTEKFKILLQDTL
jgi:hypothetical protein